MSDWRVLLAQEFKKRNPQRTIGADLGSIVSLSPLTFEMMGGDIVLEEGDYKTTRLFDKRLKEVGVDRVVEGDVVLIISNETMSDFFIIDVIDKGVD